MKKSLYFLVSIFFICFCPLSSFAKQIVIKGSTTVLPIAQSVAEAYMKEYPNISISISGGGSGNGIKAILDGSTDIANASRFIKTKEIKLAMEKSVYPVPFAVAYDCIIPVVHSTNSVQNLTLNQLKDIYKGKITNWKEVGGENKRIVVVSRDTSSGTYEVWAKKVMQKERIHPRTTVLASNGAIVQLISKNKNAIGYVGIGYLNKSLKPLKVNNIKGSLETTLDGTFPISRPLFMFTNGWPKGETKKFITYILRPDKGQKVVKKEGFVPLY